MLVSLLTALAFAVSVPALVLGTECFLALLPLRRDRRADRGKRPALAVVVPAHNEAAGIRATIDSILPELGPRDRLVVVADNCDDHTADVARDCGATVLERNDADRRGKGYAIRHALAHLAADPPEVVAVVDADCLPHVGCLERIGRAALAAGKPVQAAYLMPPPEGASPGTLISSFAVLVKNYVRPRGLQWMGMPCLITGSGVAYPWEVLQRVPHPEAHIVEDMDYSIDLAIAGFATQPCMEAVVESPLPSAPSAAETQRTRWEHGHLSVMLSQGPRLVTAALRQRSLALLVLGLELMVPPLSLLIAVLVVCAAGLGIASWLLGTWLPVGVFLLCTAVAAMGLTATWWRYGRRVLPATILVRVPHYLLGKLSIYRKFVTARQQTWIRTARDPATDLGETPTGPHFGRTSVPASKTAGVE